MRLYHYTCSHQAGPIRKSGVLRPWPQATLGGVPILWLTDLAEPDRAALGLTSHTLSCDRTAYRVCVDTDAHHWPRYARHVRSAQRRPLEFAPGALPMHWWVALSPVPILSVTPLTEVA